MSTNNFKKMEEEARDKYPKAPPEIEHNVNANIHTYSFFGKVVELFIPRIFDSLINMFGGSKTQNQNGPTSTVNQQQPIDPSSRGSAKSDKASDRGDLL